MDPEQQETPKPRRGRPFTPGTSGNPRGRPPAPPPRLDDALLAELGAPPVDAGPLQVAAWVARGLALLAYWVAAGRVPHAVVEPLRQLLTASHRSIPPHVLGELDRAIKRDQVATKSDAPAGPPVEKAPGGVPVYRRDPAR